MARASGSARDSMRRLDEGRFATGVGAPVRLRLLGRLRTAIFASLVLARWPSWAGMGRRRPVRSRPATGPWSWRWRSCPTGGGLPRRGRRVAWSSWRWIGGRNRRWRGRLRARRAAWASLRTGRSSPPPSTTPRSCSGTSPRGGYRRPSRAMRGPSSASLSRPMGPASPRGARRDHPTLGRRLGEDDVGPSRPRPRGFGVRFAPMAPARLGFGRRRGAALGHLRGRGAANAGILHPHRRRPGPGLLAGWDDPGVGWDVGRARGWDLATARHRSAFPGDWTSIWAIEFTADGRSLCAVSLSGTVQRWEVSAGRGQVIFRAPSRACTAALSPNACRLLSVAEDAVARIWDLGPSLASDGP